MRNIVRRLFESRPFIVAIESSCDDACLAVLNLKNEVIYEIKASQKKLHQPFGGIVPQLAASGHRTSFQNFLQEKFIQDIFHKKMVKCVAVTAGPGIGSCLKIGHEFASQLSRSHNVLLIAVNHLHGHLQSVEKDFKLEYPRVSLIVSGGNTQLVFSRSFFIHHILGLTIDDAIGEAIDKSARFLNCEWSDTGGLGKELERLASGGTSKILDVSALERYQDPLTFSFSGLKTALKIFILNNHTIQEPKDLAATIQTTLFGHILDRTRNCFQILQESKVNIKQFSIIGGVACNSNLRNCLDNLCRNYNIDLIAPDPSLCTDNAVMIGLVANKILTYKQVSSFCNANRINSGWNLEELCINKPKLE